MKVDDDQGRIGVFPSWRSMYWTVLVYGLVVIAVLTILSRVLSFGAAP
ncbi:MAG: hypothetical protein HKO65_15880 [Gemmatimonadetes bacterium]|nr:hypothetical protein [Gemmatimonadota bacterium]NNM06573.1 hypothetical protein [Gemmatimonadota bacterium]